MDQKHVYSCISSCGILLSAITVHYMMFKGLPLLQIKQKYFTWGTVWMIKVNSDDSGAEWYNSLRLKTYGKPTYRTLLVSGWNHSCLLVGVCWTKKEEWMWRKRQATRPSPKRVPNVFMLFCATSTFDLSHPHANVMMQTKLLPTGNCAIKLGCEALSGFKGNSWWQWNP